MHSIRSPATEQEKRENEIRRRRKPQLNNIASYQLIVAVELDAEIAPKVFPLSDVADQELVVRDAKHCAHDAVGEM
jgi:hypothetical protein